MAAQNGNEPVPSSPAEEESLSGTMRDLILSQRVEDRRKPGSDSEDAGLTKKRRRDDDTTNSANGES
jgi:hypothetical protein